MSSCFYSLSTTNRTKISNLSPRRLYTIRIFAYTSSLNGMSLKSPLSSPLSVETDFPEGNIIKCIVVNSNIRTVLSTALGFVLKGIFYPRNSYIDIRNIGSGSNALKCVTPFRECCTGGRWAFPNGTHVASSQSHFDMFKTQDLSSVNLNRINNLYSPTGQYECVITDGNGIVTRLKANMCDSQSKIEFTIVCNIFTKSYINLTLQYNILEMHLVHLLNYIKEIACCSYL